MSGFETIQFDMDGVIADTEPLHVEAEIETCRHYGFDFDPDDWTGFKGRTAEDIADMLIARYGNPAELSSDEFVEHKTSVFLEIAGGRIEPIDGILDFLGWSREEHRHMSLVTSSNARVQSLIVARFGIEGLFDTFVTGDDIPEGDGKPHPRPYQLAMERLGAEAESSLVVEDSASGIQSAKAAGCKVLAIATSHPPEELRIQEPDFIAVDYTDAREQLMAA